MCSSAARCGKGALPSELRGRKSGTPYLHFTSYCMSTTNVLACETVGNVAAQLSNMVKRASDFNKYWITLFT